MISKILYNAAIHTSDGSIANAIAIDGNKIAAVGLTEDILLMQTHETLLIDLEDCCILPGFNDSHAHLILTGQMNDRLDLKGVTSPEEIVARGKAYINKNSIPKGEWIIGYGFDQNIFEKPNFPSYKTVDAISIEHPILLDRVCGHVGTLNSLAMQQLGITNKTSITGGIIDLDEDNQPTGILREAALDKIKTMIPRKGASYIKQIVLDTANKLAAVGITSIQTDDLEGTDLDTLTSVCHELAEENLLSVRIYEEVQAARKDKLQPLIDKGIKSGDGDDHFKVGNIKLLVDGSLGARTALMREDYSDDMGNKGIGVYTQEQLDEMVIMAHNAGFQVAFHAIGDGAIEMCINSVEKAQAQNNKEMRHRIVHCQIGSDDIFSRMAKLGICADIQPPFTASDSAIALSRLGAEREKTSYAWKSMLDAGVMLGGSSDSPVEDYNPLWGIYCAVARTGADGKPWLPEQKLTIEQAVDLYTTGGAYVSFDEDKKGKIAPGYFADLVVLSKDIFKVKPEDILTAEVLVTFMDGKIRYVCE